MTKLRRLILGLDRRQRIVAAAAAAGVLAIVGVALAAVLTAGGPKAATRSTTTTVAPPTSTTLPRPKLDSHLCPLTGVRAPGGKVPQRPALAVKIGNDPASRPQSGLDQADIVYEEMAEGGITRYMAVYQCQSAPLIGPVRSVRWDDWTILQQYGHPILAYSGGIIPWTNIVASLPWLFNANGSIYPTANAYYRYNSSAPPANLGAPYNYYTSTAPLWALDRTGRTPPPPMFRYSAKAPRLARPASSASISFSGASDVVWKWSAGADAWMRYYAAQPDQNPNGQQLHATNVVIQIVATRIGPYDESGPNSGDVESLTVGSGTVYVLRNGKVEKGTWTRPALGDGTKLTFANGTPITLAPGNTWIEVAPTTTPVSITP